MNTKGKKKKKKIGKDRTSIKTNISEKLESSERYQDLNNNNKK